MFKKLYDIFIFKYPFLVLLAMSIFVSYLGYYATKIKIDASAETLLLDDDKDLLFFREVYKRYENSSFLVLTYKPNEPLLSQSSLDDIEKLLDELLGVKSIARITSILNVPLLESPQRPISDLVAGVDSLSTKEFDKSLVEKEFLNSPLYSNALVSSDFSTTAIVLHLKDDPKYLEFVDERNFLQDKQKNGSLSDKESQKLKNIIEEFRNYREAQGEKTTKDIEQIREIIGKHKDKASIFLGGVSMIASDVVGFVKSDLVVYGVGLVLLFTLILWYIFRKLKWILLTLFISFVSIVSTGGVLGFFNWEVTVISSNFVALQLIITMSITVHLIERYRELYFLYPKATQYKLVIDTVLSKLIPSFFAIITTVVGFSSLVLSKIEPVINLGLMMSVGILISLVLTFVYFPIILMLVGKGSEYKKAQNNLGFISFLPNIVLHRGKIIIGVALLATIFSVVGASKVFVENSFINYFKTSTHIYQGMKVIDESLGGTTPLDVIIKFKDEPKLEVAQDSDDEFDDFESEFEQNKDQKQYWFTKEKMQTIIDVHNYLQTIPEVGKVQSLATLLEVGKRLNNNKDLDGVMLALFYNQLPEDYKKLILSPFIDIDANEARVTMRIVDSNPDLRRDELIKKLEHDLRDVIKNKETTYRLTNLMVLYNNMLQSLFSSQIATAGTSILILAGMFMVLFRRVKLVLISLVVNLIPISLVFGIMGWLSIPLDIMTITIAAIALGIAVDDTIHFMHRFEFELKHSGSYEEAVKNSLNSVGHPMYHTTIIIVIGFSILMLSNLVPTIYFGLLTGVVMISVLISNLLLLPRLVYSFKPMR
ncbi:MAG: MMPL family transporter [Sulfurimonadaceae bacterium]|jgi:predicted RND superfamily exporter protein|nr:MMPL family transporter [Sulfurimonadaceae bacterium]